MVRMAHSDRGMHVDWHDHGQHGMRPLTQWLETSTTQESTLAAADPKFSEEAGKLAQLVRQERQKLLNVLADSKSTSEQINSQVDQVLAAEAALQRRVTQYVIAARSVLSIAQQQRLLGLYGQGMGGGYHGGHDDQGDATAEPMGRGRGGQGMGGQGRGMDGGQGHGGGGGHRGGH